MRIKLCLVIVCDSSPVTTRNWRASELSPNILEPVAPLHATQEEAQGRAGEPLHLGKLMRSEAETSQKWPPTWVNPQVLMSGKLCPPLKCSNISSLCKNSVRPKELAQTEPAPQVVMSYCPRRRAWPWFSCSHWLWCVCYQG